MRCAHGGERGIASVLACHFSVHAARLHARAHTREDIVLDMLSAEVAGPAVAAIQLTGLEIPAALPRLTSPLAKCHYQIPPCGST